MIYNYEGIPHEVNIIKKNNKNTYIRIKNNEIYITTNYFTRDKTIEKLLQDNKKSIDKMLKKFKEKTEKNKDFKIFGKTYDITYNNSVDSITITNNRIYIKNANELNKWLKEYLYSTYKQHLDNWYNNFQENIPYPSLKIRKMKTRWGVCNTKTKQITLNSELINYSIDCLDYVIVHELSHLIEGNHSKKFWSIVEKYYPDYKIIRKKLRE